MSGGVDSSVAAALLCEQGYKVFGITMVHYDSPLHRDKKAVSDAADVCSVLGIKHKVVEIKQEFREQVIDNFIEQYLSGYTPNPCVRCNPRIKWGALLYKALEEGADAIATGHYCRIRYDDKQQRFQLFRAGHQHKDQSYALWDLDQSQLSRTRFPLSELTKTQVREIAARAGLKISDKAESQEICFIEDDDYKRFLSEELAKQGHTIVPGDILDMQGNVLGQHKGYPFYTIGQRKGLGIAVGKPVFVNEIDPVRNTIRVGDKKDLFSPGLVATNANWVAEEQPSPGITVTAHIRYNDPGYPALLESCNDETFSLKFETPRPSVTPGQSAVLYLGDMLLGGGVIHHAIK